MCSDKAVEVIYADVSKMTQQRISSYLCFPFFQWFMYIFNRINSRKIRQSLKSIENMIMIII